MEKKRVEGQEVETTTNYVFEASLSKTPICEITWAGFNRKCKSM